MQRYSRFAPTILALLCSALVSTLPASAQTIYQIDVNEGGSATETGWTGLAAGLSGSSGSISLGGVTFSVISADGARHRGPEATPNPNALTGDFIFDQGNVNAAVGLRLSGLPTGVYRASVYAWDQDNNTIGDQQVLANNATLGTSEHHFTNNFEPNATTPYNFVFDRDDYGATFGIYTREFNATNQSRFNALRLERIDGKFADLGGGTGSWATGTTTWSPNGVPTNTDNVYVGNATVNLTLAGAVASNLTIGHAQGASDVVNAVTTSPSQNGDGILTIDGGALTASNQIRVGTDGTTGTINLVNGGTLNTNSNLRVDRGSIIIDGNSSVTIANRLLNAQSAGTNAAIRLDSGTLTINGGGQAEINRNGTGSLTINGGTADFNQSLFVGIDNSGSITVNGGTLDVDGKLSIGFRNVATYTQTGGNTIVNGNLAMAESGGSSTVNLNGGTLTVNGIVPGAGTTDFNFGGGTLRAGATFTTGVDVDLIGNGNKTVDTNGNNATLNGDVIGTGPIVKQGAGTLTMGGTVSALSLNVNGGTYVAQGNTTLSGSAFSGLYVNGAFRQDSGTFNANGTFQSEIGRSAPGSVTINGGTANFQHQVFVGIDQPGTLTLNGGTMDVNGALRIALRNAGDGTVNLNGGTLEVNDVQVGTATAAVTMNGGTLRAGATFATAADITLNAPNGGTFDSNGNTITLSGDLTGAGGLTKTGLGTVELSGNNSFSGLVNIQNGTLEILNAGAISNSTLVNVGANGTYDLTAVTPGYNPAGVTFSGNGTIAASGPLSLVGATLSPGNSPGTLNFGSSINGFGTYNWEIENITDGPGLGGGWDLISVDGDYNFDAADTINVLGLGAVLDEFTIHSGVVTGPFTILETINGGVINATQPQLDSIVVNEGIFAGLGFFTLTPVGQELQLSFTATVPEPGTTALLALLLAGGLFWIHRRRQATA